MKERIELMKERIEFSLGDVIRKTRQQRGLTAKKLAAVAGLSPTTVQMIENGGDYRSSNLRAIARALDCSVAELWHQVPPSFKVTVERTIERESNDRLKSA
jgi:transcriptional regulator with XRE-family HTH domain